MRSEKARPPMIEVQRPGNLTTQRAEPVDRRLVLPLTVVNISAALRTSLTVGLLLEPNRVVYKKAIK